MCVSTLFHVSRQQNISLICLPPESITHYTLQARCAKRSTSNVARTPFAFSLGQNLLYGRNPSGRFFCRPAFAPRTTLPTATFQIRVANISQLPCNYFTNPSGFISLRELPRALRLLIVLARSAYRARQRHIECVSTYRSPKANIDPHRRDVEDVVPYG